MADTKGVVFLKALDEDEQPFLLLVCATPEGISLENVLVQGSKPFLKLVVDDGTIIYELRLNWVVQGWFVSVPRRKGCLSGLVKLKMVARKGLKRYASLRVQASKTDRAYFENLFGEDSTRVIQITDIQ